MNPLPTPNPDERARSSAGQSGQLKDSSLPANVLKITGLVDLSGEWIGHYRGHYDQVIKITQSGEEIVALKITGDDHVPGGTVTFRANIRTGVGEGQVAEKEYRNPQFVPGSLKIISAERIKFTWQDCGEVEFRKDD